MDFLRDCGICVVMYPGPQIRPVICQESQNTQHWCSLLSRDYSHSSLNPTQVFHGGSCLTTPNTNWQGLALLTWLVLPFTPTNLCYFLCVRNPSLLYRQMYVHIFVL